MKSTSDKEGMSFYLPSLSSNSPFYEELVYHQNKFIVYAQQENNNKRSSSNLSSSKTSFLPSRPNTTATFNNRFSPKNQLSRNRNQESIDRFIERNQKINSIRYESSNHLKKIKANNSNYNKTLKNHQSLTQNQFFTKDKLDLSDFTKIEDIKFERNNKKSVNEHESTSEYVSQLNQPEEKLINEIKMHKNKSPEENINAQHKMMKSIKSLGKLHTERSIIEEKVINDMQFSEFSVDRERPPIEIKARNHFPLRKTISMTAAETSRFLKNSKLFNHTSPRKLQEEIKESAKKEPEIKEENETIGEKNTSEGDNIKKEENNLKDEEKKIEVEVENIFNPQFIYNMALKFNPRCQDSLEDTQVKIKTSKKVNNEKSRDLEEHSLEDKLNTERGVSLKEFSKKNIDKFEKDFLEDFIESIVKENMREMEEKLINEGIEKLSQSKPEILENRGLIETQNDSHFACSQENPSEMNMKSTSPSKFLKEKNKKSQKKMIKKSKGQELDFNNLQRAKIVGFLDDKYYKSRKGLYWKMITQEKNANSGKTQNERPEEESQSFEYPTEENESKIDKNLFENSMHPEISLLKYNIFVDKEFPHESIEIPERNEKINWLYFAPCQKSSLFPKEVKIPENYVQKSTKKELPLIGLLNCLLTINPKIIEKLIEPAYSNVFSVWLNFKGIFEPIFVDGYLPYDSRLNSLYGHTEEFLWVAVLIKAAAKIFGGYHDLEKLTVYDCSKFILGYELEILPKPEYEEIKNWNEEEFDEKIQDYLRKAETRHQSYITIHNKETNKFSTIKSIKNNKIKILDCNIEMKTHEISLFELLIDKNYELVLVPEIENCYHCSGEFETVNEGNIASYRIKVTDDKSWIKIAINNLSECKNEQKEQATNIDRLKRRLVIYEIPLSFKKQNKKEMTLKHVIDNKFQLRPFYHNKINNLLLETHIAELKKGYYKVVIECGNAKVNDFMIESNEIGFNNYWGLTNQSKMANEKIESNNQSGEIGTNNFMEGKKEKNLISFTSNNKIELEATESISFNSKILYE